MNSVSQRVVLKMVSQQNSCEVWKTSAVQTVTELSFFEHVVTMKSWLYGVEVSDHRTEMKLGGGFGFK